MGTLRICVTGAAGLLGRATVKEARRQGHSVVAMLRHGAQAPAEWAGDTSITIVETSLSVRSPELQSCICEADALIHLAARMTGNDAQMQAATIDPTRFILNFEPVNLLLASSLCVYDAGTLPAYSTLDESCTTERQPARRDAYCRAKLDQETLIRMNRNNAWILRVGALYDDKSFWNAHLGQRIGHLLVGPLAGDVPLCHLTTAAGALVQAATRCPKGIEVINVVDSTLPSRATLVMALKSRGDIHYHVPISWRLPHTLAGLIGDRGPGLLRRPVIASRLKPLKYSNKAMLSRLGPLPEFGWQPGRSK